jgi:hypothetical protein
MPLFPLKSLCLRLFRCYVAMISTNCEFERGRVASKQTCLAECGFLYQVSMGKSDTEDNEVRLARWYQGLGGLESILEDLR